MQSATPADGQLNQTQGPPPQDTGNAEFEALLAAMLAENTPAIKPAPMPKPLQNVVQELVTAEEGEKEEIDPCRPLALYANVCAHPMTSLAASDSRRASAKVFGDTPAKHLDSRWMHMEAIPVRHEMLQDAGRPALQGEPPPELRTQAQDPQPGKESQVPRQGLSPRAAPTQESGGSAPRAVSMVDLYRQPGDGSALFKDIRQQSNSGQDPGGTGQGWKETRHAPGAGRSGTTAQLFQGTEALAPQNAPQPLLPEMGTQGPIHQILRPGGFEQLKKTGTLLIQLKPEALGPVLIKLVVRDGRTEVRILTANPLAQALLTEEQPILEQAFRDQKLHLDTLEVLPFDENLSGFSESGHSRDQHQRPRYRHPAQWQDPQSLTVHLAFNAGGTDPSSIDCSV
jgi:hypothetical protein